MLKVDCVYSGTDRYPPQDSELAKINAELMSPLKMKTVWLKVTETRNHCPDKFKLTLRFMMNLLPYSTPRSIFGTVKTRL